MRDSGYKDTDHALAELIDNSIEADAQLIELIICEAPPILTEHMQERVSTRLQWPMAVAAWMR